MSATQIFTILAVWILWPAPIIALRWWLTRPRKIVRNSIARDQIAHQPENQNPDRLGRELTIDELVSLHEGLSIPGEK